MDESSKYIVKKLVKGAVRLTGATALILAGIYFFSTIKKDHSNQLKPSSSYTKVLSEEDSKNILLLNRDEIVFSEPTPFSPGDILVSGISDKTPNGLLRKVERVDSNTIYTKNATLEDALETSVFEFEISPPSGEYYLTTQKGTFKKHHKHDSLNIKSNLEDIVLLDMDRDLSTKDDQITANCEFDFHSNFNIHSIIKEHHIEMLFFENKSDLKYKIELNTNDSFKNIKKEIKVAEYNFPPFSAGLIPGTPIPFIIKPELDLYIDIEGNASPMSTSVTQTASLISRIEYHDGKWDKKGDFSESFDFSENMPYYAELKATLKPKLNFLIYGIAGPYAEANGSLQINAEEFDWELKGGLEVNLGINTEVFSERLNNKHMNIINYSKIIATGKNGVEGIGMPREEDTNTPKNLESYFFHGNELKFVKLSPRKIDLEGFNSNPGIINVKTTKNSITYKIRRLGLGEYILPGGENPRNRDLSLWIIEFKSEKDMVDFYNETKKFKKVKYPLFIKDNLSTYIQPTIEEIEDPHGPFSIKQKINYINLILDYSKRTDMKMILSSNEEESRKLLRNIKEFREEYQNKY